MEEIKSTVYPIGDKKYMINWFELKTNDKLYYDTIDITPCAPSMKMEV